MTYAANNDRTARRISDLLGQATQTKRQRSFSGGIFGRASESEHEHARSLLTPDEILRLPGDDAILLMAGSPPYRAKKLMHYQDRRFQARASMPSPTTARELRRELFSARTQSDWGLRVAPEAIPIPAPPPAAREPSSAPEGESYRLPGPPEPISSSWEAFFEPASSSSADPAATPDKPHGDDDAVPP